MRVPVPLRQAVRGIVLCGIASVLVPLAVPPAPAVAQPACGPASSEAPAEAPWPLRRLEPDAVWPLTRGQGVTVAVIDSGVSATHPLLRGKVRSGRDFGLPNRSGQCDQHYHGTVVAGIIAGRDGTGVPYTGIAPDATILPGRVLRDDRPSTDPGFPDRVGAAITWAVENGADVVNLSLETTPSDGLRAAVADAWSRGVVLVAAAGNIEEDEEPRPAYPAAYDEVIAVGGVGEDGGHVESSGVAGYVDVAAPGADIVGPSPRGEGYLNAGDGTSYAAGYVSGVVALVRAYYPELPAAAVVERVLRTADRPPEGHTDEVGSGVVNPYRAVTTLLGTRTNPPAAQVVPVPVEPDPRAGHRMVAGWAAFGGAVLAVLVLLARPVVRRGRQRRWRPARRLTAARPSEPAG